MKEADLFRQYAKEAMRWSSSKSASALERRALAYFPAQNWSFSAVVNCARRRKTRRG